MNNQKQSLSSASIIGFAVILCLFVVVLFANLNNRTVLETATPAPVDVAVVPEATATPEPLVGYFESDIAQGRTYFMGSCSACHGADARGVMGLGPDLVNNAFTFGLTDEEFREFVITGRGAFHPDNTTRVEMPARGGNPGLSDQSIDQIIGYLRTLGDPTLILSDDLRPDASAEVPVATEEPVVTEEPVATEEPVVTEEPATTEPVIEGEALHLYASDDPWVAPLIDYYPYDALLSEAEMYENLVAIFTLLYPNGIPDGVLPELPAEGDVEETAVSEEATDEGEESTYNPLSALTTDTSNIQAPVNPFSSSANTDDTE